MYIINNFVFGHNMSLNKELNNAISDFDFEFEKEISGKLFEVRTPYHGGQVDGDTYSVIFGIIITGDDGNKNYVSEVRAAKLENYISDYNEFLEACISELKLGKGTYNDDYDEFLDKLISYLQSTKPGFYSVESSS